MSIRERTIHVNWEISGQEDLREANDVIDSATMDTEQMGREADRTGDKMGEAGDKGASSFAEVEDTLGGISGQLGAIAAGSGVVATAGALWTQEISDAAGNLEEASTIVSSLGGPGAAQIRQEAEELQEASDSFFTVRETLAAAGNLLFGGALEPSQVADLIDPLSTLATVSPEFDFERLVEQVGEVLREGETIGELAAMGFTRPEVEIFAGRPFGENIDSVRKLAEAQGKQAAQQLIINELTRKARLNQQAANDVLQVYNSRWEGLSGELQTVKEEMGEGVLPAFSDALDTVQEWSQALRESDTISLEFIGKAILIGTVVGALAAVVTGAAAAFTLLSAATLGTLVTLGSMFVLFGLLLVPLIDIISFLFTGEPLLLNWARLWDNMVAAFELGWMWLKRVVGVPVAEFFGEVWRRIKLVASELTDFVTGGEIVDAGVQAMKDLAKGIKDGAKWVIDGIKDLAGDLRSYLPFSDADKGPLANLTESGASIPETLSEGMAMKSGDMTTEFQQIANQTLNAPLSGAGGGGRREIVIRLEDGSDTELGRRNTRRIAEELGPVLREETGVEIQGMS